MSTRKITTLLLLALLLCLPASAQDNKQQLNDQLWEAARKGDAAAVTALLDKGADVNAKFRYGTTALFKAAERGNAEVVKVLLARGADVNVKDTFYSATAMTWALQNNHVDVVRALLEKSPDDVDDVLLTGARGKIVELVRLALEKGGAKPPALTSALVAATSGENKNDEIAALLTKAGATPPPEIDAATLQTYVGKYRSDQGREFDINLKDGKLFILFSGQPQLLMAENAITFKPAAFDGIKISFKVENGKVTGFELQQGTTATVFKRIEETKSP